VIDQLIQLLYGIPVAGLVFQLGGYLIAITPNIAPFVLQAATPIALAALCGVLCERSGVVNIGIEGIMISAAFVGWYAGVLLVPILGPGDPTPFFGLTPVLILALLAAIGVGMLISLLHAWLSITVRADQIISGMIINIFAFGITGYLNNLISATSPNGAGAFSALAPPKSVVDIPLVGWLLNTILAQGPITITGLVIVAVFQILLFRSRWGLRTRAVGEHPRAAETVGINVVWIRYRNVVIAGALAALGGAYLSMEGTNSFQTGMTNGRGYIGLAAMIVGRWSPVGAFGAALLFASTQALGRSISFLPPTGELGTLMTALPGQFFDALPYLVTIVVLAGLIGRSIPPAADGQPYEREATT
jgi:general nucleoside transport system permease protein